VYLGGSLVGTFTHREPAERDGLIVVAMQEPRAKAKQVARAFGVSGETVRRARVRARQGGLSAVTQRGRRGAPLKRTARLRRRAFELFEQGLSISAAHRVLSKHISSETVRVLYHEWAAERDNRAESVEASRGSDQNRYDLLDSAVDDVVGERTTEQAAASTAKLAMATGATGIEAAEQVVDPVAAPEAEPSEDQTEVAESVMEQGRQQIAVESTLESAMAPSATGIEAAEPVVDSVAGLEVDRSEGETAVAETAAETARQEMSLEEVAAQSRSEMVQHVGSWLMLVMLQWLGMYELAKEGSGKAVSQVALRIALDAVAIALTVGQQCVEGIRRLATPSAATLLRSRGAVSASWARRVLGRFAAKGSRFLQFGLVTRLLGRNEQAERVWLYVDNHMRPYTGRRVIRKGWRMQDKRARAGISDYYVHDEEGRPLFRIDVPSHGSLTHWLSPIGKFAREVLGDSQQVCLCFDRGGAFPEQMATLRDDGIGFVTYERAPYERLVSTAFEQQLALVLESKPKRPVVIRYTEQRQKNLGQGRGRVRRICLLMPDGEQINVLTANCTAAADELIRRQLTRWGYQENQFKHEVERWGINQLDGRKVRPYPPDAIIPNPARRRVDRNLRIARAHEGALRRQLVRLEAEDPRRCKVEQDLKRCLQLQQELEALRPSLPTHAAVKDTELAADLVYHPGEYKCVIDAVRIGLANSESELAARLAPHLRKPREAKKTLTNLLTAPGMVRIGRRTVTVALAPAGSASEQRAFGALLQEVTALKLTLPGDPSRRPVRFKLHT
jgi:hypothetical protein